MIGSVGGRYFGMDRDQRWERTEKWYRAAVLGAGPAAHRSARGSCATAYERGETDEFITPTTIVGAAGEPVAPMRDGDAVICFNYRSDRMRQIVRALAQPDFDGFDVGAPAEGDRGDDDALRPDASSAGVPVAFPPQSMANIVGEVVSSAGLTMSAHGGNREVRARDILLQRRASRRRFPARSGGSCRARRSRRTTWRRR